MFRKKSWTWMLALLPSLSTTLATTTNTSLLIPDYEINDVHYVQSQDAIGVSLHNGLWAPLFSLGAGTCM